MRHKLRGAVQVVGLTDTGQVRPHNEDYIDFREEPGLVVLADGMGGARAGEVASEIAVNTMISGMMDALEETTQSIEEIAGDDGYTVASRLLGENLTAANKTVFQVSQSQPQYSGMGTTVVSVLFYDNAMSIAYVGDSRLYRLRQGDLAQITEDHTMIQDLVKRGFYTPEQAKTAVNKNVLTRAVGVGEEVEVDVLEEATVVGDIYLFCSDGLSDMVEDDQIHEVLLSYQDDLQQACEKLIATANGNGGRDNISVILAKVMKPYPAKRGWRKRLVDWFF